MYDNKGVFYMNQKTNNKLGNDNIGKLLFNLALPAIIAQLVNMLYNIVDRIYIGHIPNIGANALTGVGLTFPIIMIISAFSSLIGMGELLKLLLKWVKIKMMKRKKFWEIALHPLLGYLLY